MKALDIRSEGAVKLLAEFLDMDAPEGSERRYAEHFAHEVYSYVRSPYRDLFVYDSVVQYDTPPGILPPHQLQIPRRYGYGHEAEVGTEPGPSTRGNGNSGGAHTSRSRVHSRSPRRVVQPGGRARSRSTSHFSWSPSGRRYPSLKEREREVEKEERRWDRDRDLRERRRERKGKGKEWPDDDLGYEFDRQGKGKGKEREVSGEEKKRDWNRDNESSRSRRRRGRTPRLSDTDMDTDMDVVEDRDRDKKDGTRKRRRLGRAEAEAEDGREGKGKGKGKARTSRAEEKPEKDRDMDMDRKGAHKVRAGESKYTGDGTSETGTLLGYKVGCEREIREDLSRWDGASAKLKGDVDVEEPGNEEERLRSEAKSGIDEVTLKGKGKGTRRGDLANLNVDVDVEMADGLGEPLATVDSPAHPQPRRTRPRYRNLLQSVQAHLDIDIDHGAPRKATIPKTVPSRSREDAEHGSVPNPKSLLGRVSDHYVNTETTPIPRSGGLSLSSPAPTSAPLTSSTPTPTSTPSHPRNDDNSVINITVKNGIAVNGESLSTSSYDETGLPTATTTTTRIMEMETHLGMPSPELTSSSSRMSAPDIMARTRARMRLADMNIMNTAIATATVAAPSLSPGHQEGSGPDNDKSQLSPSLAHSAPGSLSSSGPTTTAKPLTSQEIMKRTRARLAQMKDKKENSSRSLSALTVPFSVYSVTLGSNANDDTVTVSVNHAESPRSSSSKTTRNQACGTETETLPEFGRGQIKGLTFSDSHAVALEERRSSLYPGSGPSHESDLRLRLLSRLEEERRENANMAMVVLDNTAHEDESHGQDEFRAVNSNALSVPNIPSDLSTDPQEKERKLRARAQLRVRLAAAKKAVVQLQV